MNARGRIEAVKRSPVIRIRDFIVMIAFTAVAVACALAVAFGGKTGETVLVTRDGETTSYPLGVNRTVDFAESRYRGRKRVRYGRDLSRQGLRKVRQNFKKRTVDYLPSRGNRGQNRRQKRV